MTAQYPGAIYSPSPNYTKGRKTPVSVIILHITAGQSKLHRAVEHLTKPSSKVSAHFLISQEGQVVQLVKLEDTAWHCSGNNGISVGIEHMARDKGELSKTDPGMPMTEAQYVASTNLVRWLCDQLNLPIDREHIKGHNEFPTTHTDCPSPTLDWNKYMTMLVQTQQGL